MRELSGQGGQVELALDPGRGARRFRDRAAGRECRERAGHVEPPDGPRPGILGQVPGPVDPVESEPVAREGGTRRVEVEDPRSAPEGPVPLLPPGLDPAVEPTAGQDPRDGPRKGPAAPRKAQLQVGLGPGPGPEIEAAGDLQRLGPGLNVVGQRDLPRQSPRRGGILEREVDSPGCQRLGQLGAPKPERPPHDPQGESRHWSTLRLGGRIRLGLRDRTGFRMGIGLFGQERPEDVGQIDRAVGAPFEIQGGTVERQRPKLRTVGQQSPDAPIQRDARGHEDALSPRVAEHQPRHPGGPEPRQPEPGQLDRAGGQGGVGLGEQEAQDGGCPQHPGDRGDRGGQDGRHRRQDDPDASTFPFRGGFDHEQGLRFHAGTLDGPMTNLQPGSRASRQPPSASDSLSRGQEKRFPARGVWGWG